MKTNVPEQHTLTTHKPRTIKTMYGTFTIDEPVILDLIDAPSFRRLQNIRQYGIAYYATKPLPYTRYEHSLGVFVLLRKFGASLEEQIAGLLHDVSHTVFSHVGDFIFKHHCPLSSYQDMIHKKFIEKTELADILQKHGFSIDDILHKSGKFKALEQDLPDICADRLEYNLYGGYVEGKISPEEIQTILSSLIFKDGRWIFTTKEAALQCANLSLELTEHTIGTILNALTYKWTARTIKRALAINLITDREIHFSTDEEIWQKLFDSTDTIIQKLICKILNHEQFYQISDETDYDKHITPKFRGIDPWVQTPDGTKRLTEIDKKYKDEYERVKNLLATGWYIKFLDTTPN